MGIYFENTTYEEDKNYILKGIINGIITKEFSWPYYGEEIKENDKVWIPDEQGNIIINNKRGKLTNRGISYIQMCLTNEGRFTSTYILL